MTSKEIDKILYLLDIKAYDQIKQILLENKKQREFENYMINYNLNCNDIPKFNYNKNEQRFTNGFSFYIINENYFNIKTNRMKLAKEQNKFEFLNKDIFDLMNKTIVDDYGMFETTFLEQEQKEFIVAKFYNIYKERMEKSKYDKREIEIANILLDNPKFKISYTNPIIKAESDIGKVYILGKNITK